MAVEKVWNSFDEAVADVPDGAVIMFGGFAGVGVPSRLIEALHRRGAKGLTVIMNDCSGGWSSGQSDVSLLVEAGQVRKAIASFPVPGSPSRHSAFEDLYKQRRIELELVPQGTLIERIRAGGAGVAGFYTPTGAGTQFAQGKETRFFDGREHVLEVALKADFALVRAHRADRLGNLVYRRAARNFNPAVATAAKVTIAEVDEIVEPGALDPESIVTPGIYVDRIVVR
jgi:3-oxoadipate CoA-transferase alpha subunit